MTVERKVMTAEGAWAGGMYVVELYYPPRIRLLEPLSALWSFPGLNGPVRSRSAEVWEQEQFDLSELAGYLEGEEVGADVCGTLSLPNGSECACSSAAWRYGGQEYVSLCLPWGSLGYVFPTDYENGRTWISEIDEVYLQIARHVFAQTPFIRGLVAYELGVFESDDLLARPGEVPQERTSGVIDVRDGQLTYYPPTTRWLG